MIDQLNERCRCCQALTTSRFFLGTESFICVLMKKNLIVARFVISKAWWTQPIDFAIRPKNRMSFASNASLTGSAWEESFTITI